MLSWVGKLSFCKVFIDDIIVFSKNLIEHISHISQIFSILHSKGPSINVDKTEIAREEVAYLGHIISKNVIRADISQISKIETFIQKQKTSFKSC